MFTPRRTRAHDTAAADRVLVNADSCAGKQARGQGAFVLKELAFDGLAKGEAGQGSVGPDHAMTRHEQADAIGGIGASDRARPAGVAQLGGELAVTACFTIRNCSQRGPYALLKSGAGRGQRNREILSLTRKVGFYFFFETRG